MAFPYLAYAVAPAAPTGPEVGTAVNAGGGPSVANLWWNSNTESDLKSYQVYRTTSTSGVVVNSSWTVAIATLAVEGTTTVESGLTNETTYYYVIVAVNLGTELGAASVTVSTKPAAGAANPSPAAPSAPGTAAVAAGGALNLSWVAPADTDLKDYRVFRATLPGAVTAKKFWTVVIVPGTTGQDAGLTNGTTYYYQLIARDINLNGSPATLEFSAVPQDTLAPATPTGMGVADVAGDEGTALRLSWNANTEADLKDYGVYRATWAGASPAPTPTRIATPGTTHQDVGLTPVTTYYFRLTARDTTLNESGFSTEVNLRPVDNSSPTAPGAPTVTDVPGDQGFALRLNWGLNTETDVQEYRVYRGTFSGGQEAAPTRVIASPGTTHQDGGLTNGATFYYKMSARDTGGNESSLSAEASSIPYDNLAPAAPAGLGVANPAVGQRLNLSWAANTETDLKDYGVYRATTAGGVDAAPTRITAPGTTHQAAGLTNGVTYYFRLTARDISGNESGFSTEASAYPTDTTPPLAPLGVGVADQPGDQGFALRLSWLANTEGDLKEYQVSRSTYGSFLAQKVSVAAILASGTTHLDGGLSLGATYYFQVTARDTSLNVSGGSAEVSAYPRDNLAPAAPIGLSGVDTPGDQGFGVSISWAGNTESDLKDYGMYRATFTGLLGTKTLKVRVTAPGTTHQDANLTNGTTYYYQVTARDATGNESGAGADFSAVPVDNLTPAVPVGLAVVDPGTTVLNLLWTASTELDLKDYGVYRATYTGAPVAPPTNITRIAAPGTTHQDGGLTVGLRQYYRVTARDMSLNESGGSAEVSAVPGTPATPSLPGIADVPADGGTALNLSWMANTEADLKDYGVYQATFALASPAPTPTRIATPGTTHQAAGLAGGSTYYFRLTARDSSSNESGYSTETSAYPVDNMPAVPAGLGAADAPVDQGFALRLSWSVNPDTDMKDYGVYRATTAGGVDAAPTRITNPGTTHQAAGLTNGATYYFRVTARDLGLNESGYSTEVSAIPYDNLAPAAPVGVGVVDVASDQGFALRISWTANTEADRKDYRVWRATSSPVGIGGAFSPAATIAGMPPGTTHQDGGLTNGTTYYFRLTARDVSLNESAGGAESPAYPQDNLPPGTPAGLGVADAGVDQGDRLNLSWTANTEPDRKDYGVYRATFVGAGLQAGPVARVISPGTTHQDTGLNPLTTFYYRLTARDVSLNESGLTVDAVLKPVDETPPADPSGFTVTNTPQIGRRLFLFWAASPEPDLKDYRIYRSTSDGVTLVSSLVVTGVAAPGTTHQDGGLTDGTTYYYRLTARDRVLNESAALGDVSAYPTDTTSPGAPAGLAASNTLGGASAGGRLSLTWTATTETDLKDYGVYRAITAGGVDAAPTRITNPGTTHQAGGLTNGTTYYVRLTTRDLTLNESGFSAEVSGYPADIVPPGAPSLTVVTQPGQSGALRLAWLSNTETDLGSYLVYGAMVSGPVAAKTSQAVLGPAATTYTAGGLTIGTTYYWQVTSRDLTGNESAGSAELSGVAGPDTVSPAPITTLAASSVFVTDGYVGLTWTAVGDDGLEPGIATSYQVRYATVSTFFTEADWSIATIFPQSWAPQTAGASENRPVGPLVSGTTYYFSIRAYDELGNGGSLSNITGNSAPAQNLPPGPPVLSTKNLNWGVRLTLTPATDPDLLRYIIFSSVFQGGPYVQIGTAPASSAVFEDVSTTIETRYYVARLEDKTGYQSANSGEVSGKPDANLPFAPTDVNAALTDTGTLISWRPPVRYLNGTPYAEKSGYRIERAAALTSPWLTAAEAAADATSWTDTTAGNFFYRVRALTGPKVPGPPSLVVSNQPGGVTMALGTDDQGRVAAVLEIGREAAEDLRAAANGRGQDVFIEVIRKPDLRTADVVEAFDFQPSLAGTGEKLAHFRFRRPVAMKFSYQIEGGQVSRLGIPAGQAAGALAVYTHNGVDWVNLGGEVDTDRREVKAKTSSLSLYRLARAARATEFRLVQVVPPRVFTPNGDGVWDVVEFFYENPTGATVTGKIFDAKGAQVADLKIGGRGTNLVWDGLHADGRHAAGGVYLYQVEFDGKVIHGAIVLAR